MNDEYTNAVDELFSDNISWGVIVREVNKCLGDRLNIKDGKTGNTGNLNYDTIRKYTKAEYTPLDKNWGDIHSSLLQQYCGSSGFGDYPSCHPRRHNLKTRTLREHTHILSRNEPEAWARILFEINEDIQLLVANKIISKYCGYLLAKKIYDNEYISGRDMLPDVKFSSNRLDILNRRIGKLYACGAISNNQAGSKQEYSLCDNFKKGFKLMRELENDIKQWKYRINWILPARKI